MGSENLTYSEYGRDSPTKTTMENYLSHSIQEVEIFSLRMLMA